MPARRSGARIKEWYGPEVNRLVKRHVATNMRVTVQLLAGIAQRKVNRSQPTRFTKSGRKVGLDPSKPFEPPKVVTSELKRNIRGRVQVLPKMVRGFISARVGYARSLELGARRSRSGAGGYMAPRPFLRPTILENKQLILATIANG